MFEIKSGCDKEKYKHLLSFFLTSAIKTNQLNTNLNILSKYFNIQLK